MCMLVARGFLTAYPAAPIDVASMPAFFLLYLPSKCQTV